MNYYRRALCLSWLDNIDRVYCENPSTGTYIWLYLHSWYTSLTFSQLVDPRKEIKVKMWEI